MSEMLCSRPGCTDKENRIDGYCSVYCRDVHEEQIENAELQRKLDEAEKNLDAMGELADGYLADRNEYRAELTRLREEMKHNVQPRVLYRYLGAARKSAEKWDDAEIINILRQTLWTRMIRQTARAQRKEG